MHDRLSIVSAERIRDELDKLLVVARPSPGLWFLVETGLAAVFLPELPGLALEQDPIHRHKDVLAHTLAVVDKTGRDRLLRLAALLHDIGKPRTRAFGPDGVTFHHHEVVGARMAQKRLVALRYPHDDVEVVTRLVELHLRFHTYRLGWTDRAVRRYVRDAGPLFEQLNELTRSDCTTRNAAPRPGARAPYGRPGAAHRGVARPGGARRAPSRTRRHAGHGVPGHRPGAGGGQTRSTSFSISASTRASSERTRCAGDWTGGGRSAAPPGPEAAEAAQSAGQTGAGSPAANSSTRRWASSSWYCTGGDFMK